MVERVRFVPPTQEQLEADKVAKEIKRVAATRKERNQPDDYKFSDYVKIWLQNTKLTGISITTYSIYEQTTLKIAKYFDSNDLTVAKISTQDINNFFIYSANNGISGATLKKYRFYLKSIFEQAIHTHKIIKGNPVEHVIKIKAKKHKAKKYTVEQMNKLFEVLKNTELGIPSMLAGFYGLRRGEILGLRWANIRFHDNMIIIEDSLTQAMVDGKQTLIKERQDLKNDTSISSIPLIPEFREIFLNLKQQQDYNKRIFGNSYNKEHLDYVFVNQSGDIMKPDFLTKKFPKLIKQFQLDPIKFHELRHTSASLLILATKKGYMTIKDVQEWLRHRDIAVTLDIYSHSYHENKTETAQALKDLGVVIPEIAAN